MGRIPTMNATMTALKFFFGVTLGRRDVVDGIPFAREPRKLPVVLSTDEVARLLAAAANIKYRAALSLAYATGLRVSEVVSLKVTDIDSKRMVVRVDEGEGSKDRYVMLSPYLLQLLRQWWKELEPEVWLFPGYGDRHMSARQLHRDGRPGALAFHSRRYIARSARAAASMASRPAGLAPAETRGSAGLTWIKNAPGAENKVTR
jgi:integrase